MFHNKELSAKRLHNMPLNSRLWSPAALLFCLALHLALSWSLAVHTAGLEYDEAISFHGAARIAGGIHTAACESGMSFQFARRCWPLMVAPYVGAPKDYFLMPMLGLTGMRVGVARMGAALLGAIGIVGVWMFLGQVSGRTAAVAGALLLSVHPSYIDLPLFDQGNIAFSLGILGAILMTVAALMRRVSPGRVFLLGLWLGLGVWGRLNFSWFAASGAIAWLLVYRRDAVREWRNLPALLTGVLLGVSPLLFYLRHHLRLLREFMAAASTRASVASRAHETLLYLRNALLSDGEHRAIWGGAPVSPPAATLVALVAAAALVWCAFAVRSKAVRVVAACSTILLIAYATSKLPVAEHHLVIFVPMAAMLVAMASVDVARHFRFGRAVLSCALIAWGLAAFSMNVHAATELHRTRGVGEWSAQSERLLDALMQPQVKGRHLYWLDWGLHWPLYLMSGGQINGTEMEASSPLLGTVAKGGVFATYANRYLHFSQATIGFRSALNCLHPRYTRIGIPAGDGDAWAFVYVVDPLAVDTPTGTGACSESALNGFYAEPNPILVRTSPPIGITSLLFSTTASRAVEIHVGAPDGPMLTRQSSFSLPNSGAATTGPWVSDGMLFYLQDVSNGKPLTPANTLAMTSVAVRKDTRP